MSTGTAVAVAVADEQLREALCAQPGIGDVLPDMTADAEAEASASGGRYTVHRVVAGRRVEQVRQWDVDLQAARRLCIGCPALAACRDLARSTQVAGVVAGLTESERGERGLVGVDDVSARDEAALGDRWWIELLGDAVEVWPRRRRGDGVPAGVLDVVLVLRTEGLTWQQIAVELGGALGVELKASYANYLYRLATGSLGRGRAWDQQQAVPAAAAVVDVAAEALGVEGVDQAAGEVAGGERRVGLRVLPGGRVAGWPGAGAVVPEVAWVLEAPEAGVVLEVLRGERRWAAACGGWVASRDGPGAVAVGVGPGRGGRREMGR